MSAYDPGLVENLRMLVLNPYIVKCWSEILIKSIKFFLISGGAKAAKRLRTLISDNVVDMRNPKFNVASLFEEIRVGEDFKKHKNNTLLKL